MRYANKTMYLLLSDENLCNSIGVAQVLNEKCNRCDLSILLSKTEHKIKSIFLCSTVAFKSK